MIKRLMLAAWVAMVPAALAAPAADDLTRLKAGETITRPFTIEGMAGLEALFWVDAPAERTFHVLADTSRLAEFMPMLDECTILETGDRHVVVKMLAEQGVIIQRRSYEPPDRITWKLIKAPGLKDMKGRWTITPAAPESPTGTALRPVRGLITPAARGTVLSYGLAIQTAFPVPQQLIDYYQSRSLPALVRNVRARVESGGTWVKPDYVKK